MEVEREQGETGKTVMCVLTDPEGTTLGGTMYLPQNAGPLQLQEIVNTLLKNVILKQCFLLPLVLMADSWQVAQVILLSDYGTSILRHQCLHAQDTKTGFFVLHGHRMVNIL